MPVSRGNLLNLIKSCDFLGQDLVLKWEKNIKKLPESFYGLIYKTFKEYKVEYESLYMKFELEADKNGEYKELIREKCLQSIKTISQSQIGALS